MMMRSLPGNNLEKYLEEKRKSTQGIKPLKIKSRKMKRTST